MTKIKFQNMALTETFDLIINYFSSNIHLLSKCSRVWTLNKKVTSDDDISNAVLSDEENVFQIK